MDGKKIPPSQSRDSIFSSIPGLLTLLFFAVLAIYFQAAMIGAFLLLFFLSVPLLQGVEQGNLPSCTTVGTGGKQRLPCG